MDFSQQNKRSHALHHGNSRNNLAIEPPLLVTGPARTFDAVDLASIYHAGINVRKYIIQFSAGILRLYESFCS